MTKFYWEIARRKSPTSTTIFHHLGRSPLICKLKCLCGMNKNWSMHFSLPKVDLVLYLTALGLRCERLLCLRLAQHATDKTALLDHLTSSFPMLTELPSGYRKSCETWKRVNTIRKASRLQLIWFDTIVVVIYWHASNRENEEQTHRVKA